MVAGVVTDEVNTPTVRYWREEGIDILFGQVQVGADMELEGVQVNIQKRDTLVDEKRPVPLLMDITKVYKMSKEARQYSSSSVKGLSAIALIVDSGLSKVFGNYALFLNKPKIPTKLFTSEKEARRWIKQYVPS